jgi:sec-independent protein translocase protein TatC
MGQPPDTYSRGHRYGGDEDEALSSASSGNLEDPAAKPFLDHLEDLRWTLVKAFSALVAGMILCLVFTHELVDLLLGPLRAVGIDPKPFLKFLHPMDPLTIQLYVVLFGGFIISLPAILFFLGEFLLPALTPREKRLLIPVFSVGIGLFLAGVLFCYFVILPFGLRFFVDFGTYLGGSAEWTYLGYISFALQMLVALGVSFELPLVILVLNFLGLVSYEQLRVYRRHAIVVIVIFAAIITPTSDPFSLAMLSIPMYLLYEACVWIARWRSSSS